MDELELEVLSDEAELDLEIQTDVIAGVTKEYVDTQDAATLASAKAYTDSELEDYRTADEQALIDATKQDLITSENKLSADLVTNGLTNKVVTQSEKDSWNSKEPGDPSILKQADVVDNVTSVLTNKPLSAKQGKDLSDRIDNISTIGRFLAIWNAATGKPTSEPEHLPYVYHTGDYFRVGTVAAQGGTNYRPNGSSYTGQASTTVYSGKLATGDLFYYDGTNWILQASSEGGKVQDVLVKSDSEYTSVVSNGNAYVDLSGKQNVISDLSTIRAGAALGDTAIQPGDNVSELENDAHYVTSENTQLTPTIPVNADTLETHPASYFATASALNTKVDKVTGKGLSENDFTSTLKNKLDGISANAKNVSVSATGTATDEVQYITINGDEKKLAGGGGSSNIFINPYNTDNSYICYIAEEETVHTYNYSPSRQMFINEENKEVSEKYIFNRAEVQFLIGTQIKDETTDTYIDFATLTTGTTLISRNNDLTVKSIPALTLQYKTETSSHIAVYQFIPIYSNAVMLMPRISGGNVYCDRQTNEWENIIWDSQHKLYFTIRVDEGEVLPGDEVVLGVYKYKWGGSHHNTGYHRFVKIYRYTIQASDLQTPYYKTQRLIRISLGYGYKDNLKRTYDASGQNHTKIIRIGRPVYRHGSTTRSDMLYSNDVKYKLLFNNVYLENCWRVRAHLI